MDNHSTRPTIEVYAFAEGYTEADSDYKSLIADFAKRFGPPLTNVVTTSSDEPGTRFIILCDEELSESQVEKALQEFLATDL